MQKVRKILRAVSEKIALPTNQPTNQLLPTTPILKEPADAGPINHFKNVPFPVITTKPKMSYHKKMHLRVGSRVS